MSNLSKMRYDYNDAVKVKKAAPEIFNPGTVGTICGMGQVQSAKRSQRLFCEPQDWCYTVEYANGSSIEIPERYLEDDLDRLKFHIQDKVLLRDSANKQLGPEVAVISYHKVLHQNEANELEVKVGDFVYAVQDTNKKVGHVAEKHIQSKS